MPKSKGFKATAGSAATISASIEKEFDNKVGPALLSAMRNIVPVRSGALWRALTFDVINNGPSDIVLRAGVDAGTDEHVDYGLWVERGTSIMKAQPYMVPALGQLRGRIK